jgi:hypothetical protein
MEIANPKLLAEIELIPPNQRFFTGKGARLLDYYCEDACVFGYGTYANTQALNNIPNETKGLYLYYGAYIKELLQEILKLAVVNNLEYLAIGVTHNNAQHYADYTEISKILSNTYLPNLRFFEYGVDELIANESCIYGNLGNISDVLCNMPKLEKLYLYGNFELTKSINLPHLTDLEVLMNDWGSDVNVCKITNSTLHYLLSSSFEALHLMSLYLDFNDDDYDYSIPDSFLNGQYTPNLKRLELNGKFVFGTKIQISNSAFLDEQTNVDIESIEEPEV